jgi:hypothetical protein
LGAVPPRERFIEVDYEALIADREAVTRQLIAFAGLDWHDACLTPERNERMVMTASMSQARQPVYAGLTRRARPLSLRGAAGDEAISMVWAREIPRLLRCARNDSKGDNPCVKPAGDEASPGYDRARNRLRVTGSCDRLAAEITEAPR